MPAYHCVHVNSNLFISRLTCINIIKTCSQNSSCDYSWRWTASVGSVPPKGRQIHQTTAHSVEPPLLHHPRPLPHNFTRPAKESFNEIKLDTRQGNKSTPPYPNENELPQGLSNASTTT